MLFELHAHRKGVEGGANDGLSPSSPSAQPISSSLFIKQEDFNIQRSIYYTASHEGTRLKSLQINSSG